MFKVGQGVSLHPCTDFFMMGMLSAEITCIRGDVVYLYHHISRTRHKVNYARLEKNILTDKNDERSK